MSVTNLTVELATMVVDHLDLKDVPNSRLAGRIFQLPGLTAMQRKLTRLSLHPARLSDVIAVCQDETWSKGINEIVIIGKGRTELHLMDPEIETIAQSLQLASNDTGDGMHRTLEQKIQASRHDVVEYTALCFQARPWPPTPFSRTPRGPGQRSGGGILRQPFMSSYEPLISAVGNLKSLHKLTHQKAVSEPGLCGVTENTVLGHSQTVLCSWDYNVWPHGRWTDTGMLFGMDLAFRDHIDSLNITHPLPMFEHTKLHLLSDASEQLQPHRRTYDLLVSRIASGIKDITVAPSDFYEDDYNRFLNDITSATRTLRSLKILYTRTCYGFFEGLKISPSLERLEIQGMSVYRDRLSTQALRLILQQCEESLRVVKVTNVVLLDATPARYKGAIKDTLEYMRTRLNLSSAELVFLPPQEPSSIKGGWRVDTSGIDELAVELELKPTMRGKWDFAEALNLREER